MSKRHTSNKIVSKNRFTINASGDVVAFAMGNLQYRASDGLWRFAEMQHRALPPWKWNYEHFDWLDVAATMLGGVMADVLRVGLFLIIYYSVR